MGREDTTKRRRQHSGRAQIRAGRFDAGIADLREAIAWFEQSRLHHVRVAPALRLAEGYLLRGDLGTAQVLIDDVLTTSRAKGYRYVEGLAHRLLAECLAQKSPTFAAEHIDAAQQIFISTDARNDLAKVLVTRAGLCQNRMYARPEVRAGVARLAAHGLVLDAWCYHPQLTDVIALVRAVPQATIVMCHVGGVFGYGAYAGKKDEIHAEWRASIAELATCPNVSVKLGGMLNRGAALNFREHPAPPNTAAWAAAWRPYVEPCIELFGAERCSFESNFPVDKMGTGYATLWNAFKRITAGCSPTEKLALYSGTAKRLYRLD